MCKYSPNMFVDQFICGLCPERPHGVFLSLYKSIAPLLLCVIPSVVLIFILTVSGNFKPKTERRGSADLPSKPLSESRDVCERLKRESGGGNLEACMRDKVGALELAPDTGPCLVEFANLPNLAQSLQKTLPNEEARTVNPSAPRR